MLVVVVLPKRIEVNEPTFIQKNGLYIGVGFIGAMGAVGAVVYVKKYRGS